MNKLLTRLFLLCAIPISTAVAETSKPLTPITVAEYGEFPLYTALYVAHAKGYFRDGGLDVSIVPAGGDEKVFAALLSGSAQFGVGDPLFTAISGEKGQPGRIICAVLESIPGWGVAKRSDIKPFKSAQDLKGYSLGTYPGPSTSYTLGVRLFQLGGLEPNIKPIAYGSTLAALEAGAVDIVLEYEPVVSQALAKGGHTVFAIPDYFPKFALTGLAVLPEYLDAHPDVAQAMANAFQRAFNDIHGDLKAVTEIVAKRFPEIPQAELERAFLQSRAAKSYPQSCHVSKEGWDVAVNLRREVGDLKSSPAYEEYVVTKFADKAKLR